MTIFLGVNLRAPDGGNRISYYCSSTLYLLSSYKILIEKYPFLRLTLPVKIGCVKLCRRKTLNLRGMLTTYLCCSKGVSTRWRQLSCNNLSTIQDTDYSRVLNSLFENILFRILKRIRTCGVCYFF